MDDPIESDADTTEDSAVRSVSRNIAAMAPIFAVSNSSPLDADLKLVAKRIRDKRFVMNLNYYQFLNMLQHCVIL